MRHPKLAVRRSGLAPETGHYPNVMRSAGAFTPIRERADARRPKQPARAGTAWHAESRLMLATNLDVCNPLLRSGARLGRHVRSRRFVRGEGPRPCKARSKFSALPTDPTERGGPPPLLGLSPRTVRSGVNSRLPYAPHSAISVFAFRISDLGFSIRNPGTRWVSEIRNQPVTFERWMSDVFKSENQSKGSRTTEAPVPTPHFRARWP